jgi:hypothetical protein
MVSKIRFDVMHEMQERDFFLCSPIIVFTSDDDNKDWQKDGK